ncbi:Mechanosensitive ion channel [Salinimicrobium catena]|uniref:Mechanosensitive ion channel n=1 Tax=Salinimicrobium catena TaxID=390640 RepID=A0A1H5NCV7_9FLAO|nr:mechanosensitive ion channel domain-containing protein [Salinimicrobium catena]SDL43211.1 Mechanosensitive ion channel [Salinimicrobium catena]SEE99423.1 Mechanosensitive ion channel [Salinimicrobium catena]
MQQGVDQVKEVIEEDIWGTIQDFLNYSLINVGSEENPIRITVWVILLVIVAFLLTNIVMRGIRIFFTRKMEEPDKLKFISVFKFIRYLVYVVVIIVTLSSAGIDITILLTASAALFVGLGLALQELFQDIIGGLFIIIDKSLLVGDVVEMDGRVGRVIDIKLRTTRLLTRDDKVMIIPNHKFTSEIILNFTQNHRTTRELVRVGVAYGSDTEKVKKLLLESVHEQAGITKKPSPFVLFEDFGDSALIFSVNFFVTDSFVDPKIKSQVRYNIDQKFREHNITIPFPQRDVHFFNRSSKEEDHEE